MKLVFRILAPLVIVAAAGLLAWYFVVSRPEPKSFAMPPQIVKVDATRLEPEPFQVFLQTQGTVRPRTTSNLIPEVSGRIVEISPNFREGGFFEKDETLVTIDPVNYETALVVAESAVAEAKTALSEEEVRAGQAAENWRRLGKQGEPSDLAARKPQLELARANLRAAEAQVEQAKRDLERTEVRAPFSGRILEQNVDVGQVVSSSTQLGRAFATDVMEVRLPLTNRQTSFVELPERFRNDGEVRKGPEVFLTGGIGRDIGHWTGRLVRVDSSIDEMSRQLFVVAEVEDPYRRREGNESAPLKIGLFVDALIKGEVLEDVFVLPRQAVRVGGEVVLIDEDNRIRRQKVEPVWSEEEKVVIPAEGGGLKKGDVLCLTPLAYPANGAEVLPTIDGVTPEVEQPGRERRGKGKGELGEGSSRGAKTDNGTRKS
ncbi:MAG: efflux RND transporter periplasmic adaptor subunit [Verrucomicrobiales bacterium]